MIGYDSMNISRFDDPSWYLPDDDRMTPEEEWDEICDEADRKIDEERERRSER